MKSKKVVNQKKAEEKLHGDEDSLSLGDKIYLIYHITLGVAVYLYVDYKYKYEYTRNTKDITAEVVFVWLIISGISLAVYLLIKKIIKKPRN